MDFPNVQAVPATVYNGLNSDELERLPETAHVHHATPVESRAQSSLGGVLLTRGARSLCGKRMTLLLPRTFDLADPHACSRCLEVLATGSGARKASS